ncbi:MAG: aminotransferase class I/II-fold pyridoxal phosphate-dependent enzyme [Bacteroidales bacterium]|nr:aminotransferase class I/II-fold pyridoxal phosphate-dependent enzyme [Bacteroidales bacterium]
MNALTWNQNESINPNLNGLEQSDTLAINERSKELMATGKKVYRFGLGQSPFPVPRCVVEALRLNADQKDYLPVKGLLQLREAVAEFHRKKDNINVTAEHVIIGPGSKELVFLLQLVFNSDIIITSPCWVSYVPQAKIIGKGIDVIHSSFEDKWQLTPALFRGYLKNRGKKDRLSLLILNYPGNPDGVSLAEDALKEIAALARENNIIILSDEIYGQLNHSGQHVSIAKYYPEGTIISSGLSKWCGAGGWRLGTFAFPKNLQWILEKMAIVASETYTSVSAPIQFAAVKAFKCGGEIEEYLWQSRKILAKIGNECAGKLNNAGIKTHAPVGGFYLFLDFSNFFETIQSRGIKTSKELCTAILNDTGVAVLQGSSFNCRADLFTARMAYIDFDGARVLAAARTIPVHQALPDTFTKIYCSKVLEGVDQLIHWFQ